MSIKAMLKYEQLMDIYDEEVANVNTPLDDWFGSNPEQLDDDEAILTVFSKELRAEPLNRRGAPARVSVLKGAEKKRGAMFHMFNQLPLPMDVLHGLREPDSHLLDRKAAREIRRQIRAFVHRQRTTRELWWSKLLTDHTIYVNRESGYIVESSGSNVDSITFGVPASHRDQINDGTSDAISTSWDNSSADIIAQLEEIVRRAELANLPKPTHIWCTPKIKEYIRNNTDYGSWADNIGDISRDALRGDVMEGFAGFTWHFVQEHVYEDVNGTVRRFLDDDKVILTPEQGVGWQRPVVGLDYIPSRVGLTGTVDEALSSLQETYGPFMYASVEHNPPRLSMFAGDHFGTVVAEPEAIWTPTVVFT